MIHVHVEVERSTKSAVGENRCKKVTDLLRKTVTGGNLQQIGENDEFIHD